MGFLSNKIWVCIFLGHPVYTWRSGVGTWVVNMIYNLGKDPRSCAAPAIIIQSECGQQKNIKRTIIVIHDDSRNHSIPAPEKDVMTMLAVSSTIQKQQEPTKGIMQFLWYYT